MDRAATSHSRTSIREILTRALSNGVVRPEAESDVWYVDDPSIFVAHRGARQSHIDDVRREVMQMLIALHPSAFISHSDDPTQQDLPGDWEKVSAMTWRLPAHVDLLENNTEHWLFALGNWVAYAAHGPVTMDNFDPFKRKPSDVTQWMRENGVAVLIAVFPDAAEWLVALAG